MPYRTTSRRFPTCGFDYHRDFCRAWYKNIAPSPLYKYFPDPLPLLIGDIGKLHDNGSKLPFTIIQFTLDFFFLIGNKRFWGGGECNHVAAHPRRLIASMPR